MLVKEPVIRRFLLNVRQDEGFPLLGELAVGAGGGSPRVRTEDCFRATSMARTSSVVFPDRDDPITSVRRWLFKTEAGLSRISEAGTALVGDGG